MSQMITTLLKTNAEQYTFIQLHMADCWDKKYGTSVNAVLNDDANTDSAILIY